MIQGVGGTNADWPLVLTWAESRGLRCCRMLGPRCRRGRLLPPTAQVQTLQEAFPELITGHPQSFRKQGSDGFYGVGPQ